MKAYKNFNKETYRKEVLNYIRNLDLYNLLKLVESKELGLDCLNLILKDIYKLVRNRKPKELLDVEELLILLIDKGGDVNQHDKEGYSVLMNSLYISWTAVKRVLEAGADLSYINEELEYPSDIFEYVSSLSGTDKGEKLYTNLYKSLKEVYPTLYREKMKAKQKKKFNL
jgi:hypothetical protein